GGGEEGQPHRDLQGRRRDDQDAAAEGQLPHREADGRRGVGRQGREEVRRQLQDQGGLMAALALRKEVIPIRTSPPHPAAKVLGERADAVRARFEASTGYRRTRAPEWLLALLAPVAGLALLVALWALIAKQGGRIPDPITVAHAAAKIFADPFYSKGPNDQGIGWNVLMSLKRVGIGFGMSALVGILLAVDIERFRFPAGIAAPNIALVKPMSRLTLLTLHL